MAAPKVFFVHLRRPKSKKRNPDERRDDPFYEFGSFGCTGCHRATLFRPRHAGELQGARLAFIQGGPLGHRLVFLTPPVTVTAWKDRCEAKWTPAEMPFKYAEAPILAWNNGRSNFPLVEKFASDTKRRTIEGGLSSKLRSVVNPLSAEMTKELISVYEKLREKARPSDIATNYEEALPWLSPTVDRTREATYRLLIAELRAETDGAPSTLNGQHTGAVTHTRSQCGSSRHRRLGRTKRCT